MPRFKFFTASFGFLLFLAYLTGNFISDLRYSSIFKVQSTNLEHLPVEVKETKSPSMKQKPICLISTWSGFKRKIPQYFRLFADSVERNDPFLTAYIFYHNNDSSAPHPMGNTHTPHNMEFISISDLDASYTERGFPGLLADQLCLRIWKVEKAMCKFTQSRARKRRSRHAGISRRNCRLVT